MSNTLSIDEVIEGLTDWFGDGVNSIIAQDMVGDELGSDLATDDDITGYRILIETTDGLKPSWMPTEISCYPIVVRQGGPYKMETQNGR